MLDALPGSFVQYLEVFFLPCSFLVANPSFYLLFGYTWWLVGPMTSLPVMC